MISFAAFKFRFISSKIGRGNYFSCRLGLLYYKHAFVLSLSCRIKVISTLSTKAKNLTCLKETKLKI